MAKEKQETRFSAELLDELLEGQDAATVLRSDGLVGDLKRALAERMLNAEMDVHSPPPRRTASPVTRPAAPTAPSA